MRRQWGGEVGKWGGLGFQMYCIVFRGGCLGIGGDGDVLSFFDIVGVKLVGFEMGESIGSTVFG